MQLRLLGLFAGLAVASAAAIACSPQNAGLISTTHVIPPSYVRVLNGAPDVDPATISVVSLATPAPVTSPTATPAAGATPSPTPSPNPLATALPYGAMTAYGILTGDAGVTVSVATSTGTKVLTCTTPSIGEQNRFTIVIAGRTTSAVGSATGLQCDMFADPVQTVASGRALIGFHHAAPTFASSGTNESQVEFGIFPNATPPAYQAPLGSATFVAPTTGSTATGNPVYATIDAVKAAPGIGVYASAGVATAAPAPTTVYATALPENATAGAAIVPPPADKNDVIPFTDTTTNITSSLFDVFLIDSTKSTTKAQLVGAFD